MKFPSAHSILILIAALVAVATWIVPAGKYDNLSYSSSEDTFLRSGSTGTVTLPATQETLDELNVRIPLESFTNGDIYRPIGIPGSYRRVEANPQGFGALAMSPIKGIIAAADIIFLVLIIGGLIGIMSLSGAFDAGIAWLANILRGREYLLIIFTTFLAAIGGTTFGFGEEALAFYPILIPVFIAARYDAMVGLASVFLGAAVGYTFSTINPFSTIIASDTAGIVWTTGLNFRLFMFVAGVSITIAYILRYASKVRKDPSVSVIHDQMENIRQHFGVHGDEAKEVPPLTFRRVLILMVFTATFIVMIVGVSMLDWWFVEMTTTFLVGAIIIGFIAKINESEFVEAFTNGAGSLLGVAFIIGIARGVTILMNDGMISDTVLYHASSITEGMGKGLFINSIFLIYNGLTFLIPSSSGLAVLSMPIMAPLADSVGVARDTVVSAYMYGNGLFNIFNPTGLILASLAIVKISFDRWLKFVWPIALILALFIASALTLSVYFGG